MATNDASGGTYVARRRFLTRRKVFVSGGLMTDMKVCADIAMFINPNLDGVPHLPKDLEGKPFDDAAVIERLSDLYLKFLDRFGPRVAYLFNHAAVLAEALGIYLGAISGTLWNPPIVRFMAANAGSSGLLTSNGRAKPAARVWCEEAAEYYRYRREADWLK